MTVQTERKRRPGQDDAPIAQQPSTTTNTAETSDDDQTWCMFPRRRVVPSDFHRMVRPRAEYRASQLREPGAGADVPTRLTPEQRAAQIRHAVENAFLPWELAALVPGPVTDDERALAHGAAR